LKKGATCVESLTGAAKLGGMVFLFHRRLPVKDNAGNSPQTVSLSGSAH
jgi:hypothetical protein